MKNLQKLRAKIIEEIPEIVELKFGCEVKSHQKGLIVNDDYILWKDGEIEDFGAPMGDYLYLQGYKVIGRPITLADILSVLEMIYEDDESGNAITTFKIPEIIETLDRWEFSKKLEDQSKPTIDFLTSIILTKNK